MENNDLGGKFTTTPRNNNIARLNADGSVDTLIPEPTTMWILISDGRREKIIIGGLCLQFGLQNGYFKEVAAGTTSMHLM
jgi:hypothetical protein